MQCGFCTAGMILVAHALLKRNPAPSHDDIVEAISATSAAAPATDRSSRRSRSPRRCAARPDRRSRAMMRRAFKFVSTNRRVREDRRFVVGRGNFVADIKRDGMLHVAIVPSRHAAARIVSIDAAAALAVPGVHHVLTGAELAAAVDPMLNGLDTPHVRALFARSRTDALCGRMDRRRGRGHARHRRGCRRAGRGRLRAAAARDRCRGSARSREPAGPSRARLQRAARQDLRVGRSRAAFRRERRASFRSASPGDAAPRFRSRLSACWRRGTRGTRCSTCGPRSRCRNIAEQIARALRLPANAVRVHYDVDVGGSYGVKRGIKHTVLVGISRASSAGRCG